MRHRKVTHPRSLSWKVGELAFRPKSTCVNTRAVPYEFKTQLCLLKYFGLLWIISSVGKRAERTRDPSDSSIQPGGDVPGFKSQQFPQAERLPKLLQEKERWPDVSWPDVPELTEAWHGNDLGRDGVFLAPRGNCLITLPATVFSFSQF